jgi:hypothetical protein
MRSFALLGCSLLEIATVEVAFTDLTCSRFWVLAELSTGGALVILITTQLGTAPGYVT